jgi:D-inositol-3-phosphate glycosyltransferase
MKKIAFISEHASPLATIGGTDSGGQNVYVAQLAKELIKKGYSIDIYTRWEHSHAPELVEWEPNLRVVHIEAGPKQALPKEELWGYMPDFLSNMNAFMASQGLEYDLIHANFWMSGWVAMELKKKLQVPYIITFHALGHIRKLHQKENDRFPAERCEMERQIAEQADKVIAECPQDKEDLIEYYGCDASKIEIAACGFSKEEFFPVATNEAKERLGFAADEHILLQLGRMVPRKGVETVVRALSYLNMPDTKIRLVIVGGEKETPDFDDDSETTRLYRLAKELHVDHMVHFAGRRDRDQLKYYYSAADVFITTPWYEPFGITPLEAMACGTPVIGSEVGGIKYSVVDGKTGLLIPPKDPETLAERIRLLINNPNIRAAMSAAALERVNRHFTWSKVASDIHTIYQSVRPAKGWVDPAAVHGYFIEAQQTFREASEAMSADIILAAEYMASALAKGNKILICGNGGSAAESQHFAAELVGRFEIPYRTGLPAMALTADSSILTAWSNDFGFEDVFSRQVQAFGKEGDVLVCLSTSGESPNILKAIRTAEKMGMTSVNILGKKGGKAAESGTLNLIVPSSSSQRIQEVHLFIVHVLCKLIEKRLFESSLLVGENQNGIICKTEKQYS